MRFNGAADEDFIRAYCRGFPGRRSVVLGYYVDGILRGAGELIVLTYIASCRNCEIALSVEGAFQGRGVGTELVRRLIVLASNRRIRNMHVLYTRGNKRMDSIARRVNARISAGDGQMEAIVAIPRPSDWSVFEEALINGARRAQRSEVRASMPRRVPGTTVSR